MPSAIELHDSDLTTITRVGSSVTLLFSPAYLHRWKSSLGDETSTGWLQRTTFTFSEVTILTMPALPVRVSDGFLRIGDVTYDNIIPADGLFETPCEFRLIFNNFREMVVQGKSLLIMPCGEPSFVEKFAS